MAEGSEERDPLIEHTDDKTDDDGTFNLPPPVSASTPHNQKGTNSRQPDLKK